MSRPSPQRRLPLAALPLALLLVVPAPARAGAFEKLPERSRLRVVGPDRPKQDAAATCRVQGQSSPHPIEAHYAEIKAVGLRLLKEHVRSDRDVVVGLDRSSAPLIAWLQNFSARALNFPARGLLGEGGRIAQQPQWPSFFEHFAQVLGPKALEGAHRILLVDRCETGGALSMVRRTLQQYLRQNKSGVKPLPLGLADHELTLGFQTLILPTGHPLVTVHEARDEAIGRFAWHTPASHGLQELEGKVNAGYDKMKASLLAMMTADAELTQWLADQPPLEAEPAQIDRDQAPRPAGKHDKSGRRGSKGKKKNKTWADFFVSPLPPVKDQKRKAPPKKRRAKAIVRVKKGRASETNETPALVLRVSKGVTYEYLDRTEYGQIRDVAADLMRRFPPSTHFLVFAGQSTVPLQAFYETVAPHNNSGSLGFSSHSVYLPADGLSKKIRPEWQADFDAHFQRFLPPAVTGNRQIVLVRQATSGTSLSRLTAQVKRYLQAMGRPVAVSAVGLSEGPTKMGRVGVLDISAYPDVVSYRGGAKKPVAPYASHRIGKRSDGELRLQKGYQKLLRAMQKRAAEDKSLAATLQPLLGGNRR